MKVYTFEVRVGLSQLFFSGKALTEKDAKDQLAEQLDDTYGFDGWEWVQ